MQMLSNVMKLQTLTGAATRKDARKDSLEGGRAAAAVHVEGNISARKMTFRKWKLLISNSKSD